MTRGAPLPGDASLSVTHAHVSSPKPGETANGDAFLVRSDENGRTLLAVIDGLGHGPDAAMASHAAIERLRELSLEEPLLDGMQSVHRALKGSRGAAGTVCILHGNSIEACAVGNVQFMCAQCDVPLVVSAGVLGHHVAKFRIATAQARSGARLALLSDGISTRFRLEELRHLTPQQACELVMSRYRRLDDDATILVGDLRAR
jgi:phosphoserine phosphatase RsbX